MARNLTLDLSFAESDSSARLHGVSSGSVRQVRSRITKQSLSPKVNLWVGRFARATTVAKLAKSKSDVQLPFASVSAPLSMNELIDLEVSELELKRGQGRRFKDLKSLLADLNGD